MAFTFVHASDLHLDTPFKGIKRSSADLGTALLSSTLAAFDRLVALALDQGASFLVISGDVFDGPRHGIRAEARLVAGLSKLGERGIRVFIATGNHDPLGKRWDNLTLPPNVSLFSAKGEAFTVERDGKPLANVAGISYPKAEVREDLAPKLPHRSSSVYSVAVLHATLGSPEGKEPYAPTTMASLQAAGYDYYALGHVHTRAVLRERAPTVAYPGNIQALSSRETGPRGAFVVRVDDDNSAALEFFPLDGVRFCDLKVDARDVADIPALVLAIRSALDREVFLSGEVALVVTVELCGQSPLYEALSNRATLDEMMEELKEQEEDGGRRVWFNDIENTTRPVIDLDAQEGLGALIVDKVGELIKDGEKLAQFHREVAAPLEKGDLGRILRDGTVDQGAELLAARDLVLDLLGGGS